MFITSLFASQISGSNLSINQKRKAVAIEKSAICLQGLMRGKKWKKKWKKKQGCSHLCKTCETYSVSPTRSYVNMQMQRRDSGNKCTQQIDTSDCLEGGGAQRIFAVDSNPICTVFTASSMTRKIHLCMSCFIKTDYRNIILKKLELMYEK